MKDLKQFCLESLSDKTQTITLSIFSDMLRNSKYKYDDISARCSFMCVKCGLEDDVTPEDHIKLEKTVQAYYDADKNYRSNVDSFLSKVPKSLSALFGFTSFEDEAVKKYEPVKNARKTAYDVLCGLINKYKSKKVSESVLEAMKVHDAMQDAIQIAFNWQQKVNNDEDKEFMESCVFWTIVYALDQEGNTWAKEMYDRTADKKGIKQREEVVKEITSSDEYKMILDGVSKIFDQSNQLQGILDTLLEPVDDEDDPSEWKLSAFHQKLYDSELKKLETMKKDFIDKCRALK